jgi:teichoic acid transport system permease protein
VWLDAATSVGSIVAMSSSAVGHERVELRDAHESARLKVYLRELWQRRSYVHHVSLNELKSRQVTNVLGNLWHLLNPALSISVFYVVFGLLLKTDRGVDNFLLFLTTGLFIYQSTQSSTIDGAKSIVTNKGIIKAVRFPRVLLPLTSTWTEFLASLSTYVVLFLTAFATGQSPRWTWFAIAPIVLLQLVFNAGLGMFAARAAHHFIDTIQILPFVFRLVFYGSGVIFSVDAYVESDKLLLQLAFILNPMYCFITMGRWAMMGSDADPVLLLSATGWSVFALVAGFFWFRAGEEAYARD